MKIVHVNSDELAGGAARAAHRLHRGMQELGLESHLVVQRRRTSEPDVHGSGHTLPARVRQRARQTFDRLPLRLRHGSVKTAWSTGWVPNPRLIQQIRKLTPDLVILHWGGGGFLPNALLSSLPYPIFWVLHDMAPFTGGCHYDRGCGRFETGCGRCPLLQSDAENDLSARTLQRKRRHMEVTPHAVVAPSQWIAAQAQRSLLFAHHRIETIHHPHDLEVFRPTARAEARAALGWAPDRTAILFGAVHGGHDPRKGFDLLAAALANPLFSLKNEPFDLHVFGASDGPRLSSNHAIHYHGEVDNDARMALLYAAADAVVVPSRQEAFGLTGSEAHCCGTPVIGFAETGLADVIAHRQTGYLAQAGDASDLAAGIKWVIENPQRRRELGREARHRAERLFDLRTQSRAYLALFHAFMTSSIPIPANPSTDASSPFLSASAAGQ